MPYLMTKNIVTQFSILQKVIDILNMYALADWFAEPPLDPPLNLYGSHTGTWVVIIKR